MHRHVKNLLPIFFWQQAGVNISKYSQQEDGGIKCKKSITFSANEEVYKVCVRSTRTYVRASRTTSGHPDIRTSDIRTSGHPDSGHGYRRTHDKNLRCGPETCNLLFYNKDSFYSWRSDLIQDFIKLHTSKQIREWNTHTIFSRLISSQTINKPFATMWLHHCILPFWWQHCHACR